ncbi:hypothetical protein DPQ33_17310 [Oceanidesulfovibrio indonesiensis]|uniref:Uncharacterized protein n=1 Tax=Oceanidesulfovibrio indonesiensis TaxID=54767 RepID=A0A7M3MAA3_9BACT|nr:hypothetical protein [Oceanidesulfovibrio indonesiensis]TVM14540.1 hypothetical protein DPQ33_17310 [Oceanidesulfovibrio indonesiensis]
MAKDKKDTGEGKKIIESKYDATLLRDCVQQDMNADEMLKVLGIKNRQTLKRYLLRLMHEDRAYYEIKGLHARNSSRPRVNAKMELRISLKSVDLGDLDVNHGDEFSVAVDNGRIVLDKL